MELGTLLRENRIGYDVFAERRRQEEKWGEQNHPSVHPAIGTSYQIATESEAKHACACRARDGLLSWADIAIEELAEAIDAPGDATRRDELIQLAAVIVAWIENIDRNTEALQKELTE